MSTPSQGLLLSNYKLRGPPAGCPLGALAPPHPGTHSPALSVGASLPAPQVTLPRVTWVPCPPRPVYQRKEPLYTSPWRSLKTCSLRLLSLPFQPTHEQSHHLGACTRCAPIPRSCPLAPAPYPPRVLSKLVAHKYGLPAGQPGAALQPPLPKPGLHGGTLSSA